LPLATPPEVSADTYELLLSEVESLAGALSLPNATSEGLAVRIVRWRNELRAALSFAARGTRILVADLSQAWKVLRGWFSGEGVPSTKDFALLRRISTDVVMTLPYAVIMIVPLTPVGHVLAFSLMNKLFPGSTPTPFTAQRQDVYEIYANIAAAAAAVEEAENETSLRSRQPGLQSGSRWEEDGTDDYGARKRARAVAAVWRGAAAKGKAATGVAAAGASRGLAAVNSWRLRLRKS